MGTRWAASRAGIQWAALPPRTQRIAAGEGACVLVLVMIAALVFGPLSSHGPSGSASPGVAVAFGSEAASESAWPSESASASVAGLTFGSNVPATPTPSPTPWTPDDGVSPRQPDTLVKISDCLPDTTEPVSSGGRLYVSCNKGSKVIAIDLATDKVAKIYSLDGTLSKAAPDMLFVDHGLWVSLNTVDATGGGPAAADDTTTVQRLDLTTGKKTAEFSDSSLVDDVSGALWMYDVDGNLDKVNPSSAKKSIWNSKPVDDALSADGYQECGYIWTETPPTSANSRSPFIRLDPATGITTKLSPLNPKDFASFVIAFHGTCWGVVDDASKCPQNAGCAPPAVLEHLGPSCIDMVTSKIADLGMGTQIWELGDTLWIGGGDEINQVEPFGGKQGRTWILPNLDSLDSWIVDANGQVWVAGGNGLMRVNIPLDKMTPGPTPPTLTCPGAAPSASPSASVVEIGRAHV